MISNRKKELIAIEVIKILYKSAEYIQENLITTDKNPFNMCFYKGIVSNVGDNFLVKKNDDDFISLSSWLYGLNTTLGQSFFENVAHILSDGYKKEFTSKRNTLLKVTSSQKQAISNIITELKNGTELPNIERENDLIFNVSNQADLEANSFTVDVYIESDTQITAIELKSVKPNAGETRGEKQKILEAKSALYDAFSGKEIKYYIGFPFDPTSETPTSHDKIRFLDSIIDFRKYFALGEVFLANELWDLLSGDNNTMEQILEIINSIATPEFMDKYNYLNENLNHQNDVEHYRTLLQEWFLFREIDLLNNNAIIIRKIMNNPKSDRIFKQPIFKNGDYNSTRYDFLKNLVESNVSP